MATGFFIDGRTDWSDTPSKKWAELRPATDPLHKKGNTMITVGDIRKAIADHGDDAKVEIVIRPKGGDGGHGQGMAMRPAVAVLAVARQPLVQITIDE